MKIPNLRTVTYIALAFHLIAAIFSTGFHHFDEHFQILEFLGSKMGTTPIETLPWEYHERVRPWIQVWIYAGFYKFFSFFGVTSHYVFAFIFRFFTGLFGLASFWALLPVLRKWFPQTRHLHLAWALLNLVWFVPYIHVRASSEALSSAFFIFGLAYWARSFQEERKNIHGFVAGLFFGASFLARSQMGFLVMFTWFWGLFFKTKTAWRQLCLSAFAILIMFLIGFLLDSWGYGEWVVTQYNYVRTNFFEGKLASGNIHPWWYYFRTSFLRGIPPLSIVLMVACLWFWIKNWRHLLTWSMVPLLILHSSIGHKEVRYLFPVFLLAPLCLAWLIQEYETKWQQLMSQRWWRTIVYGLVSLNFLFLIFSSFRPANPSEKFFRFVHNHPEIRHIYVVEDDPYTMVTLPIHFFRPAYLEIKKVNHLSEIPTDHERYVFFHKGQAIVDMENSSNCRVEFLAYPRWILHFNIGNWLSRSRVWSLYKCQN